MSFTLKVIELGDGDIVPDDESIYGGIDYKQIMAFRHLFPIGFVHGYEKEIVYDLADLHGWAVTIRKVEITPKDNPPECVKVMLGCLDKDGGTNQ
jgi:hypothetical protein